MNLQHITVKLFALDQDAAAAVPAEALIPVYHRIIQQKALDGLLIDVADYAHVEQGPGVMLIAQEGQWALDAGPDAGDAKDKSTCRVGVQYANKRSAEGSTQDRLRAVIRQTLAMAKLLQDDATLEGLAFSTTDWVIRIDDRLEVSNDAASFDKVKDDVSAVLRDLLGDGVTIEHVTSSDDRIGLTIKASASDASGIDDLLGKLAPATA